MDTIPAGFGMTWDAVKDAGDKTGIMTMLDDNTPSQPKRRWVAYAAPDSPPGTYNLAVYDGVTLPQPYEFLDIRVGAVTDKPQD
jgi:hypothetical protein